MKYCPYCGKPQNDAAKFCTECGVNFETGPVTASNAAPAQPTQQAAEASAVSAAAPILETAAPENKVGKKTKLFIWLGAALAVLASVVVFMSWASDRFSAPVKLSHPAIKDIRQRRKHRKSQKWNDRRQFDKEDFVNEG